MTATTEHKTGLGHQYKAEERYLNAARKTLQTAWMELYQVGGETGEALRNEVFKLITKVDELSSSANEAYRIND